MDGNSKLYRYEDFANGTPQFDMISEINPNPQVAVIPKNYRGTNGYNLADIGVITGYPTISWSVDVFNVWLAQNNNIIDLQTKQRDAEYVRNSLLNAIGGNARLNFSPNFSNSDDYGNRLSSGINIVGDIASSVGNRDTNKQTMQMNYDYAIAMQNAQIEKQKLLPDEAHFGSNNATLLGYDLFDKNIFTRYSIKRQFAERIDKYFDMFGYLTNNLKLPNLNNRPSWNYVKTIGANILGSIPQLDLLEIKEMFDNGITLWHNPSTFLDYTQNNRVNE